jgi:hypothetical protein
MARSALSSTPAMARFFCDRFIFLSLVSRFEYAGPTYPANSVGISRGYSLQHESPFPPLPVVLWGFLAQAKVLIQVSFTCFAYYADGLHARFPAVTSDCDRVLPGMH